MIDQTPQWLAPASLQEALELRAEYGDEATVVAGGTYLGILMNQGFLAPETLISLHKLSDLRYISANGELHLGAMTTHRAVERSPLVHERWPALAQVFSVVASPRVRNQATVGGVLADADYASDPPAMLAALEARAVLRSPTGEREVPVEEFITGYYETDLGDDELLVEVVVPGDIEGAVYRKFRSRSTEDRPCVAVAATRKAGRLRVVVGAVTEKPQHFPDVCTLADGTPVTPNVAAEIGQSYAERIEPISDSRGSSAYRRRIIAVEVRRAIEELGHG